MRALMGGRGLAEWAGLGGSGRDMIVASRLLVTRLSLSGQVLIMSQPTCSLRRVLRCIACDMNTKVNENKS